MGNHKSAKAISLHYSQIDAAIERREQRALERQQTFAERVAAARAEGRALQEKQLVAALALAKSIQAEILRDKAAIFYITMCFYFGCSLMLIFCLGWVH